LNRTEEPGRADFGKRAKSRLHAILGTDDPKREATTARESPRPRENDPGGFMEGATKKCIAKTCTRPSDQQQGVKTRSFGVLPVKNPKEKGSSKKRELGQQSGGFGPGKEERINGPGGHKPEKNLRGRLEKTLGGQQANRNNGKPKEKPFQKGLNALKKPGPEETLLSTIKKTRIVT